jgi:hypothetical protein
MLRTASLLPLAYDPTLFVRDLGERLILLP